MLEGGMRFRFGARLSTRATRSHALIRMLDRPFVAAEWCRCLCVCDGVDADGAWCTCRMSPGFVRFSIHAPLVCFTATSNRCTKTNRVRQMHPKPIVYIYRVHRTSMFLGLKSLANSVKCRMRRKTPTFHTHDVRSTRASCSVFFMRALVHGCSSHTGPPHMP